MGVRQRAATDCLTACIATVTGIPYEKCPQLWEYSGVEWIKRLSLWAEKHGLALLYWENPGSDQWPVMAGMTLIAGGKVGRSEDYLHAVVMKSEWDSEKHRTNLIPVFDPSGKDFIDNVEHLIALIPDIALQAERAALWEVVRAGDAMRPELSSWPRSIEQRLGGAYDLAREKLAELELPTNAGIVPKP